MKRSITFITLSLVLGQFVWAQQFRVLQFGQQNGLDNSNIRSVSKDSIGFIWIASEGGLFRFDGSQFESVKKGIGSSYIRSLVRNERDELLFSCDDGVYEIRSFPDTVIISPIIPASPEPSDSTLCYPNNMFATHNGALWISEQRGSIVRVDKSSFQRFDLVSQNTKDNSNSFFSFAVDKSGNLWVASQSGYVFVYNREHDQFIEMFDADRLGIINQLIALDDGSLLLLGDQIYHARINRNGFLDNLTRLHKLPSEILHAAQGSQGTFYFGTKSGLYRASYERGFQDLEEVFSHNDPHRVGQLPFGEIREIRIFDENIWLSTDSGVGLMKTNLFEGVESLPSQHIYSVSQVAPDKIMPALENYTGLQ